MFPLPDPTGQSIDTTPPPAPVTAAKGTYTIEEQALLSAASDWSDVSAALKKASTLCEVGWGYPGLFGFTDALWTEGQLHQSFNKRVVYCAADGAVITQQLANGLTSTVNVALHADADTSDDFATLAQRKGL